jgi:hypothetical protein
MATFMIRFQLTDREPSAAEIAGQPAGSRRGAVHDVGVCLTMPGRGSVHCALRHHCLRRIPNGAPCSALRCSRARSLFAAARVVGPASKPLEALRIAEHEVPVLIRSALGSSGQVPQAAARCLIAEAMAGVASDIVTEDPADDAAP